MIKERDMGMADKNKILFIAGNDERSCKAEIYELKRMGVDIVVAGETGGIPVNDAINSLVKSDEQFDAVILNMYMACGQLDLEDSDNGWQSGKALMSYLRNCGVFVPFIVFDDTRGMHHDVSYIAENLETALESGEKIPVILKDIDTKASCKEIMDVVISLEDDGQNFDSNFILPTPMGY